MSKCRIDEGGRECSVCGSYLTWDKFPAQKSSTHGKSPDCRVCRRKVVEENKHIKKELYRTANLPVQVKKSRPVQDFIITYGGEIYM